jgi:hypothetical protein
MRYLYFLTAKNLRRRNYYHVVLNKSLESSMKVEIEIEIEIGVKMS